ncbi:CobW family GTP-binding protein [Roseomonas sp. F4]
MTVFGRPQSREGGTRIPVIVLTGFLGAGKTTLIRHFLDTPDGAGTAVVVNEFGEVGIDQALLRASTDATVLLGNGCLCCAMRSDLQQTLRALHIDRARNAIPAFRRVVVETSGIADPGPILQTFLTDRALGDVFFLAALICVVDAATLQASLHRAPEVARQVALADRFVLTKTDLVDAATRQAALDALRAANPAAPVAIADQGVVEPEVLLTPALSGRRYGTLFADSPGHLADLQSFSIVLDAPLDWAGFAAAMEALRTLRGPDLLRVKGLLAIRGQKGPVVVHIVQHLAHPPSELAAWPDDDHRSRLVFITRGIARETVTGLLAAMQSAVLPG